MTELVNFGMQWLRPLVAASPAFLTRFVADNHAAGFVTAHASALDTLSTLYVLTPGSAQAELINRQSVTWVQALETIGVVLCVSIAVAALLAGVWRALRLMSLTSET
jgi:hypothetical protein